MSSIKLFFLLNLSFKVRHTLLSSCTATTNTPTHSLTPLSYPHPDLNCHPRFNQTVSADIPGSFSCSVWRGVSEKGCVNLSLILINLHFPRGARQNSRPYGCLIKIGCPAVCLSVCVGLCVCSKWTECRNIIIRVSDD